MVSEEQAELLVERLIQRIEYANTYFLMKIGASVGKIRELTPAQAQQLVQILKYGGNYDEIVEEISKYTNLDVAEIEEIFEKYAQKDREFYRKFYEYRNIPFEESSSLRAQRNALTEVARNELYNFTRSNVLGYTIRDLDGVPRFYGLRETYNRVLDEALLNVGQGKQTFDAAMSQIMKDIGGSGLKTIEFASGRSMRLDSAARMHLKERLRELHNENQKIIGEEIGADGVEISVHSNPAPDHMAAQGHQFSNEEYEKLNAGLEALDYKGKMITLDHDGKNGYRPISTLNCYHYIFSVVLGVSKPLYSDKELRKIIDDNNKGFEIDGKHYTMYEGTQLQRQLERRIREQKDTQILAKTSGNDFLAGEAQNKITALTRKYKELNDISGLPPKIERLKVSAYRRSASATKTYQSEINKMKIGDFDISKYTNEIKATTNDVILTPKMEYKMRKKHPDDMIYFDKMPEIMSNPDQIYLQTTGHKDTIWAVKEYDGQKVQMIIKLNKTTLYQQKELGYKNSIIHMHRIRNGYAEGKVRKKELKLLFDINDKK